MIYPVYYSNKLVIKIREYKYYILNLLYKGDLLLVILKKLRRKISITLSTVLAIGTCFTLQISNAYAEEDLSTKFYEECAKLIQENWDENYYAQANSVDSEFQTMRLILKLNNNNLDVEKYEPKDIVKYDNKIVLQFDTIEKTKEAYEDLKSNKYIDYVEVDKIIELNYQLGEIVDKDKVRTTNSETSSSHNSWGVERIEANEYSKYLYNQCKNNNLIVAVVDTGVDYDHSYLSTRLSSGYNFIYGNYDIYDDNGHGTHVSGTIVDCTLELSNIKILPVKVLNEYGKGTMLSVGNGIEYAASKGANVINLSLTGDHSSYVDEAIEYAVSRNISVIVAAGNDNSYINYQCPAHISDAIVVASTGEDDYKSSFSNYGSSVDICAPGENVLSCYPGNSYAYMEGTSMSTPHISAIVAMYKLGNPNLSVYEIDSLLKTNTKDLGSIGWDMYYGYGIPKLGILAINSNPIINASDKVIKVGDAFNPLSGVSANDEEDGNLTAKIVVNENTVDTSQPGIYKVVYSVTDSNNATTTKEINVRVVEEGELIDIDGHWAESQIKDFISKGYIVGYGDFTFRPNASMTRAEFIKVVNRVFGFNEKGTVTFNDVKASDWFYDEVAIAQKAGYINGRSDTTFAPQDKITRQEVAVILTNIKNNKDTNYDKINKFTDGYKTSEWAKSSVEGAIEAGYLSGDGKGLLNPTSNITRAEAVTMLSRLE